MAIPKAQIEAWSSQGAITTSKDTYTSVKSAVTEIESSLPHLKVETYLQGSYGNNTNVVSESDVDVVVIIKTLNGSRLSFSNLNAEQRAQLGIETVNYQYSDYTTEMLGVCVGIMMRAMCMRERKQ